VARAAFMQNGSGNSYSTSVSGDGRYTVFLSTAANLVTNQVTVNSQANVFLFDKQAGTITLVNHVPGLANTTGNLGVEFRFSPPPLSDLLPVISADGSTVAFVTYDTNLLANETSTETGHPTCIYLY